jgi:hypothetical protein
MNWLNYKLGSYLVRNDLQIIAFFVFFWTVFYLSIYVFCILNKKYKIEILANITAQRKMSIR